MNEQTVNAVIDSANDPLGLSILGGSIGARKAESNVMTGEVIIESVVIEFMTIVCLRSNERQLKLDADISMKMQNALKNFRLGT